MIGLNLIQDIADAKSMDELKSIILKIINFYGVNDFNYGIRLPNINNTAEPYIFSGCHESWINHYKKARHYLNDSTISYSFRNITPVIWDDALFKSCKLLREESQDAGLVHGITFPIHGSYGEKGLFAIAGKNEINNAAIFYINALVPFIHDKIYELELKNQPRFQIPRLTPREQEFLKWLAIGKTMEEISIIMRISYRTCVDYSEKIKRKLHCTSKNQVISMAISRNLINL